MRRLFLFSLALTVACTDVSNPDEENDEEVITTVALSLDDGTGPVDYLWSDPEGDGSPVVDTVTLVAGVRYEGSLSFINELAEPAENITPEILDEADEHQVLFTHGGDIEVTVADSDANGLPVGLDFDLVASGDDALTVTLRHLPEEDGRPQKTAGLQEQAQGEGLSGLPGESDVSVTFDVMVTQP